MKLLDYLNRIKYKFSISDNFFIYAFIIFEKIIMKNSYNVKIINSHKLYFVSFMISLKFLDDQSKLIKIEISSN